MRKQLITIFSIGFIILFVMMMLQTLGGNKYEGGIIIAWGWLLLLYIPLLYLVFQIKKNTNLKFQGLIPLSALYVFATLLVLLLQPLASAKAGFSFLETLKLSTVFLLPLEGFLGFLLWKKILQKQSSIKNDFIGSEETVVFISYNHNDKTIAEKIQRTLETAGIKVIIDSKEMQAGEDIKTFIKDCIRESNVTLSLVSNDSLRSAWVAMETINSFYMEQYVHGKKFIACYLDEDFFQSGFTLKMIIEIDKKIKENQKLILQHHEKMLDTRDLNNENSRLLSLRNNLDEIVRRLRESLCLDVRDGTFETSMQQLINTLNSKQKN